MEHYLISPMHNNISYIIMNPDGIVKRITDLKLKNGIFLEVFGTIHMAGKEKRRPRRNGLRLMREL